MVLSALDMCGEYARYSTQLESNNDLADKITLLSAKLKDIETIPPTMFGEYEVRDLGVSVTLNFVDLKTLLECGSEYAIILINQLGIGWNIEKINTIFPFLKQIQEVSNQILQRLTLFDLQMTGSMIPVEHSPLWYGLVEEKTLLNRQVVDLSQCERKLGIVVRRIKEIALQKSDVMQGFVRSSFSSPWLGIGVLQLTIGKLCMMQGAEINKIAKYLPPNVCALLSDQQVKELDFTLFSEEQLDRMIGGDETDVDAAHRLTLLNEKQMAAFLKISSGVHFRNLADIHFRHLDLTEYSGEKIAAFFDDDFGRQRALACYHLHLVPPKEIAKIRDLAAIPNKLSEARIQVLKGLLANVSV